MAKSMNISVWTPPAVTREEALRQDYNDDGDRCLDVMVSPELPHEPSEYEKYELSRLRQTAQIQDDEQAKNRRFEIDQKNFTGKS